ncbi:MAG: GvpL/GvpF family gas vesicle protein [Clostridiaceae bacterium]|nr:GvpL/GvpF family gas vesicle protein [Clostridiaceae bacterium]
MALMGKYIYCFIREKEKITFGNSTIGNLNAPVYTITCKNISAVVSDAPIIDYDPTRKSILAHQAIVNKVMDKYTIIPVAFGTVANKRKNVEAIINAYYEDFDELLDYFKDKMEVGLRITWNKEYFNIDIESDEIKRLKEIVSGKEEKRVLSEKIELGKLVEAEVLSKRKEYEENIYEQLENLNVKSKLKEKVPIKTVFNAYFLIEKSKEAAFDKKVLVLSELYTNKLNFNYTGPWPPYNFVDINIDMNVVSD